MTPEQVFSISNSVAVGGWLVLAVAGRTRWAAPLVMGAIMPLLFGVAYLILLAGHWGESEGGFSTLAGVQGLFANPWLLLAGWLHYLAFDLFIGSWQVRDVQRHGIAHWMVLPCLVLTLMFGPVGLLLYFGLRLAKGRGLVVDEMRRLS